MKRNIELIRRILLAIEDEPSTQHEFNMKGVDNLELWYNVDLLVQANLIRGVDVRWAADGAGPYVHSKGLVALTWTAMISWMPFEMNRFGKEPMRRRMPAA